MDARPRIKDHIVEVISAEDITPWYRRVTVDPRGLFETYDPAPGAYLLLAVPTLDGTGTAQRMYTLHNITPTSVSFEFVIHEPSGPGCHFAQTAQPGDQVMVSEPPYHVVIPDVSHAVFIADTTAMPAISSFLGSLRPDLAITILLEDSHPDHDLIPFKLRENTRLTWVNTLTEADLIEVTADLDPNDCFLWAGGERHIAKTVKEYARDKFVVPRENQHIQTYWIAS